MTIEKQHALLVAQQNQQNLQAEQKKDELIALANNISNNLTSMVHQQQMQPPQPTVNVIPTATVLPPSSATIIPGQVISAPVLASSSNPPLIGQTSHILADQPLITSANTLPINPNLQPSLQPTLQPILNPILNPIQSVSFSSNLPQPGQFQPVGQQTSTLAFQQQPIISQNFSGLGKELPCLPTASTTIVPPHFDSFAPTNLRTIRPLRPTLSLGATQPLSRKDRRRLPLPTYEEIQQATVALGLNNRLSGLSTEKVVGNPAI